MIIKYKVTPRSPKKGFVVSYFESFEESIKFADRLNEKEVIFRIEISTKKPTKPYKPSPPDKSLLNEDGNYGYGYYSFGESINIGEIFERIKKEYKEDLSLEEFLQNCRLSDYDYYGVEVICEKTIYKPKPENQKIQDRKIYDRKLKEYNKKHKKYQEKLNIYNREIKIYNDALKELNIWLDEYKEKKKRQHELKLLDELKKKYESN